MASWSVETAGRGPRVVLVHGSVTNGAVAWSGQRPLADRFTLVVPSRSGYPPNPALGSIDFEDEARELAALLEPGDHLVGHSYGGVVSLLAAAQRPAELRSLTVVEPPAFAVARGVAAVDEVVRRSAGLFAAGPSGPREYLEGFLPLVGSAIKLPDPLPPELEQGARAAMAERPPWEAEPPLEALARAPFPKLVVSGGHHPAFEAVCDVLERALVAERATLPGSGHSIQRAPGFNQRLATFLDRAEAEAALSAIAFPLVTERLLLRPFAPEDAEALLAVWGDPANDRFIGGATPPRTVEEAREWMAKGMPWGVWERDTGELVGDCGLFVNEDGQLELAYGFRRDRWGRGYATEAGAAALRAAFEQAGAERVVADVDPAHERSRRVLEKLGFEQVDRAGGKLLYAVRRAPD